MNNKVVFYSILFLVADAEDLGTRLNDHDGNQCPERIKNT